MSDRAFLDTNVVVYAFDADAPSKQEVARRLLEDLATGGRCVVSTQVLQEFFVTVTRKLAVPLPQADAERATRDLSQFQVVPVDVPIVFAAIATSRDSRISYWDALIIEAARTADCRRLLSEDLQAGRRFGSVVVENPFD
jgi:predicted nucleic acid-binding protein